MNILVVCIIALAIEYLITKKIHQKEIRKREHEILNLMKQIRDKDEINAFIDQLNRKLRRARENGERVSWISVNGSFRLHLKNDRTYSPLTWLANTDPGRNGKPFYETWQVTYAAEYLKISLPVATIIQRASDNEEGHDKYLRSRLKDILDIPTLLFKI